MNSNPHCEPSAILPRGAEGFFSRRVITPQTFGSLQL